MTTTHHTTRHTRRIPRTALAVTNPHGTPFHPMPCTMQLETAIGKLTEDNTKLIKNMTDAKEKELKSF
jgi:hypothetical protein